MKTMKVIAPSTLEEGYTFDVVRGGRTFKVTVPRGGVSRGEEFEVPYPERFVETNVEQVPYPERFVETNVEESNFPPPPPGTFKHGLFDCCDVFCKSLFWMSLYFRPITEAQLLTRMNLNWCGSHTDNPANTLCVVVAVTVILFILYLIVTTRTAKWGLIFLAILVIYRLVYTCRMRRAYRKKYNVPASCCGDGVEDCCVVFWCDYCSLIQLARHTHDENKYPYRCCSKTGLAEYAPAIV